VRVSVVIPAYNCEAFVAEAIDSALSQDHAPAEVIVVDDGSTDGTRTVVRRFGSAVRLLEQANGGPARARNAGVRHASGDAIAFLDADDVWLPGKLRLQVQALSAHPDVDVAFTDFGFWDPGPDGKYAAPQTARRPASRQDVAPSAVAEDPRWFYCDLLMAPVVTIIAAMVRRPLFDAIGGFDEALRTGEDYEFWLRASRHTRFVRIPSMLAAYRTRGDSVTRRPMPRSNELDVFERYLQRHGALDPAGRELSRAEIDARRYALNFDHAYAHLKAGSPSIALRHFAHCIRLRPRAKLVGYLALAGARLASARGRT
jgi:glycosyltransferase involved in cell wall biosynthesis